MEYPKCSVEEFEKAVKKIEKVRIVVRAPKNAQVLLYDMERCKPYKETVSKWLEDRVLWRIKGYEYAVVCGNGSLAKETMTMQQLRGSYHALKRK